MALRTRVERTIVVLHTLIMVMVNGLENRNQLFLVPAHVSLMSPG